MVFRIFDTKKGKMITVGTYDVKNKAFTKKVKHHHYFQLYKSYAIQEDVVQQLQKADCQTIIIIRDDLKIKLTSQLCDWLAPDIKTKDFGYGVQRFMPVDRMVQTDL